MFTGLVEEIGEILNIENFENSRRIRIKSTYLISEMKIKDSVSVDGCCQTIVEVGDNYFDIVSIKETLIKTIFGNYNVGNKVNLELAMKANTRLGGHFVQGHIDSVGKVIYKNILENSWEFWIEFDAKFSNYLIPVGSVSINGTSLTIARIEDNKFMVAIIPYTFEKTNFQYLEKNSYVNLEFDMLGKYIIRFLENSNINIK